MIASFIVTASIPRIDARWEIAPCLGERVNGAMHVPYKCVCVCRLQERVCRSAHAMQSFFVGSSGLCNARRMLSFPSLSQPVRRHRCRETLQREVLAVGVADGDALCAMRAQGQGMFRASL